MGAATSSKAVQPSSQQQPPQHQQEKLWSPGDDEGAHGAKWQASVRLSAGDNTNPMPVFESDFYVLFLQVGRLAGWLSPDTCLAVAVVPVAFRCCVCRFERKANRSDDRFRTRVRVRAFVHVCFGTRR